MLGSLVMREFCCCCRCSGSQGLLGAWRWVVARSRRQGAGGVKNGLEGSGVRVGVGAVEG